MTLAELLRTETRDLHRTAERTGIMASLVRGEVDRDGYARLLRALFDVYEALEAGLARHAGHPVVSMIHDSRLDRVAALRADLDVIAGDDWYDRVEVTAPARALATRITLVARESPELLIAHAYVRYLGDLSGGQVLRRIVRRMLQLDDAGGTAFYEFESLGDLNAYKDAYRSRLSTLPLDTAAQQRVVEEACRAFAAHVEIFATLAQATVSHGM